ncbi:MAG: hypothetical protein WCX69_01575 [Candidatus Paceibacterota bacterium]
MKKCETFEPEGSKDAAIGKKENATNGIFFFIFMSSKIPPKAGFLSSWAFIGMMSEYARQS